MNSDSVKNVEPFNLDFANNARWFVKINKNDFSVARFKSRSQTPQIHFSNLFCFSAVTAGQMKCKHNGNLRNLSTGELNLFMPKSLVSEVSLDKTARLDCLYIDKDFLEDSVKGLESLDLDLLSKQASLTLSGSFFDSWKRVIEVGLSSACREIVYDYIIDFIDQAIESIEKGKCKLAENRENELYFKTLEILKKTSTVNLEDLSLNLNISKESINDVFSKYFGITAVEFINAYNAEIFREQSIKSSRPLECSQSTKQAFERAWQTTSDEFNNVIYLKTI